MSWQAAARGSILRLHRGVIPRSTGVGSLHNKLHRLCLSVNSSQPRPQLQSLAIGVITQSNCFATASKQTKETKKPRAKATKRTTKKPASRSSSPKKKKKKPLTKKQQEAKEHKEHIAHIKQLTATALKLPKKLPTAFQPLALQEKIGEIKGQHAISKDAFKAATELTKEMGTHDRERIKAQIEENRKANAAAYESFIKSHTPLQIKEANVARRALSRLLNKRQAPLVDDRLVKKPLNAFVLYVNSRLKTNEFEGMRVGQPFRTCSEAWSQLPPAKKEEFEKLAVEERNRYNRQHEEVYGFAPRQKSRARNKL